MAKLRPRGGLAPQCPPPGSAPESVLNSAYLLLPSVTVVFVSRQTLMVHRLVQYPGRAAPSHHRHAADWRQQHDGSRFGASKPAHRDGRPIRGEMRHRRAGEGVEDAQDGAQGEGAQRSILPEGEKDAGKKRMKRNRWRGEKEEPKASARNFDCVETDSTHSKSPVRVKNYNYLNRTEGDASIRFVQGRIRIRAQFLPWFVQGRSQGRGGKDSRPSLKPSWAPR